MKSKGRRSVIRLTWKQYDGMKDLALKGVEELFGFYDRNQYVVPEEQETVSAAHKVEHRSFSAFE